MEAFCINEHCRQRLLCPLCILDFHRDHVKDIYKVQEFEQFLNQTPMIQRYHQLDGLRQKYQEVHDYIIGNLNQLQASFLQLINSEIEQIHNYHQNKVITVELIQSILDWKMNNIDISHLEDLNKINNLIEDILDTNFIVQNIHDQQLKEFYLQNIESIPGKDQISVIQDLYRGGIHNNQYQGRGILISKYGIKQGIWQQGHLIKGQKCVIVNNYWRILKGEFNNWKLEGIGESKCINGNTYKGEFKEDNFNGVGSYCYIDGSKYGQWHSGRRDGFGTFHYVNGDKEYGLYVNDRKHGKHTYYVKNKVLKYRIYQEGQLLKEEI